MLSLSTPEVKSHAFQCRRRARRILDLDLAGVAGILLCAALMAKGIGF